jgi:streptogrisin C
MVHWSPLRPMRLTRVTLITFLVMLAAGLLNDSSGSATAVTSSSTAADEVSVEAGRRFSHDMPPDSPPLSTADEALAADARTLADQNGLSVGETMAQLERQEAFDALVVRLKEDYVETFAGSWGDDSGRLFVRFKGDAPTAAVTAAAELGVTVTIQDRATQSAIEMQTRAGELHADLMALGTEEVATSVSVERQLIEATVMLPPGIKTHAELLGRLPASARAPDILINLVSERVLIPAHTYGGAWMRADGSRVCTSAFSARRGSTFGVTTAGHCAGVDEYEQPEDGLRYAAPFVIQHYGDWGDIEFHTTPDHSDVGNFYADVNDFRNVASVRNAAAIDPSDAVCAFGRKSLDRKCGSVVRAQVQCGTLGHMVGTDVAGLLQGDSGGPWFLGTVAYGSFMGWCTIGGEVLSLFTVADYFDEAIGAIVLSDQ